MCGFTRVEDGDKVGGERAGCQVDFYDVPLVVETRITVRYLSQLSN